MYPTNRIQLFDKDCNPIRELAPREVLSRVRHEEINGEHALTIETTRHLEVGWRALTVDSMGVWREWVVEEPDETHDSGYSATGTYRLVWSMQYDLSHTYDYTGSLGHREVGISRSASGSEAVALAIRGTRRWTVGRCDVQPCELGKGVVMIAESAWDCLSKVVDAWGGELDATIEVGLDGVTARKVNLLEHIGTTEPTRRFEWGRDLTSISRSPDPGPYYCRVIPTGKTHKEYAEGNGAEDSDSYEFDWPLSILDDPEYNPTILTEYIEDEESALVFRVSDGRGDWEYPTKVVKYDQDDVQLLYEEAVEDLHNHTRPNVTYTATVMQLAEAGMDTHGVSLGDEIQVVDWGFNEDFSLAIQERVIDIRVDELDDFATELTIGEKRESLVERLAGMTREITRVTNGFDFIDTDAYVEALLDRINQEINATGGYSYLVPGEGLLTFDVAVRDPLNPIEASQAVQIKGGSIRIANSRRPDGSWDWKTVFKSGHIVTELVTSGMIETGYVGNPNGNSYWDLDNDYFRLGARGEVSGRSVESLVNGVWTQVTNVEVVTQWMQADTGITVPNLYNETWSQVVPDIKPNMILWKRDKVTLHTALGTSTVYRNVESVLSSRNLLPDADSPVDGNFYLANSEVNYGVIKLVSSMAGEERFHAMWKTEHLTEESCDGCTFRLSFDAKKSEHGGLGLKVNYAIMDRDSAELGFFPTDSNAMMGTYEIPTLSEGDFATYSVTFDVPSDMTKNVVAEPWAGDKWLAIDFEARVENYDVDNLLPHGDSLTASDLYLGNAEVSNGVIKIFSHTQTGQVHYAMWRNTGLTGSRCNGHHFTLTFDVRKSTNWYHVFSVVCGVMYDDYADRGGRLELNNDNLLHTYMDLSTTCDTEWKTVTFGFTVPSDMHINSDAVHAEDPWDDGWLTVCFSDGAVGNHDNVPYHEVRNVRLVDDTAGPSTNDIEIRNVALENLSVESYDTATAQYYLSSSSAKRKDGSWSAKCQEWNPDYFFWTRTRLRDSRTSKTAYTKASIINIGTEQSAIERGQALSDEIHNLGEGLTWTRSDLTMAIFDASRVATDYMTYRNGKLILGATDSAVRNVMTNSKNSFETNGSTVAYFGYDDASMLWQLFIANAQITDMLRFGNFAWIARQNGNMTLKWTGE